ncbi:transmembrane protein 256 homolog [Arctopsyche grandis]|uniref:transmembrane protein 256 homolog n=1 Tax=Arctopsyche grandis TaxID=121162 RepID=UPI00406D9C1D
MGYLADSVNYVIFTNPVSTGLGQIIKKTGLIGSKSNMEMPSTVQIYNYEPLHKLAKASGPFVRIAGLMGASAVVLGAYGAHKAYPEENKEEMKRIYETANKFHFIHSVALLGVPMCRKPVISGTLLSLGIVMFCGSCYYTAFTGDRRFRRLAPIGGTCFILGWLAMIL